MRTFKQFVSEEEKAEPLVDLIERRCKPFLNRSGRSGFLYRGISSFASAEKLVVEEAPGRTRWVYVVPVRKNRRPLTTDPKISRAIDAWFEDRFGIRGRSQAIFCYGERGRTGAEVYGHHTCAVFPIGSFTYVWSPLVNDLYFDADLKTVDPSQVDHHLSQLGYTMNDLDKAVKTDSEIMVDCDRYIAIPYNSLNDLRELHELLQVPF